MDNTDIRILSLASLFIIAGLLGLGGIAPASAQYGGWGVYGPYGRPPPGAYDYPRNYVPPFRRPRPWGPQMRPCIYYGDCRGNPMPRY